MNKTLLGMAILPFLAGTALAAAPLTDAQMDKVTAGHVFSTLELTNQTFIQIDIDQPSPPPPANGIVVGAVILPAADMQVVWGILTHP